MKKVSLAVWEDFEERVAVLSRERAKRKQATGDYISEYLYRGQSDSSWRLETTLERYTGRLLPLEEYYQIVSAMKPQIETYTGARWEIPSPQEYAKRLSADGRLSPGTMPEYEYLIYLRHHGFPSPLLDWSASPYVAAYFAFRNVSSKAASVSVYVYCEYTRGVKHGSSAKARISGFGPNVRGHRRHFQQQSAYTVCTVNRGSDLSYARHDDAFANTTDDQDELWQFNIPASERQKVLERLQQYNINAFSLFGSEESLMETLSLRELFPRATS